MGNRYFTIANILLITAGVYLLVNGFYTMVTAKLDPGMVTPPPTSDSTATSPVMKTKVPLTQYHTIRDRNLFNTTPQGITEQPEKVDLETLKQTDLKTSPCCKKNFPMKKMLSIAILI